MLIFEILWVALSSLRLNLLRSLLTMLGVIIGVAAVITMVALGEGAQSAVRQQIQQLGSNRLTVRPGGSWWSGRRHTGGHLTLDEARKVAEQSSSVVSVLPILERTAQLEYEDRSVEIHLQGTWVSFPEANSWPLAAGRFFTESEEQGRRRVAVIGSQVAEQLFSPGVDPVGQTVRLRGVQFEIIGTLVERGDSGFRSRDDVVVVPLSTAQSRLYGTKYLSHFLAEVVTEEQLTLAMAEIESVLRRSHRLRPGTENDFSITRQTEFLNLIAETGQTFTFLLAGIAMISLLVGGIGIMNIMLVSVTERTREIGVRKAIGATRWNIQLQFLIEAVVLSCAGGVTGIVVGWSASRFLADWAGWQMLISPDAVSMAFGFSAMVGILFGFYPARRASRLDPIDALRYE